MNANRMLKDVMNIQKFDYFVINKVTLITKNGTKLIRSNRPKIVIEFNRVYIFNEDELRCLWFNINEIETLEIVYSENIFGEFFSKKELYKVG